MQIPELFSTLPEAFAAQLDPDAPWALLGEPLDAVLDDLPSDGIEARLSPDVHLAGDRIVIGRGTVVQPGALLEGPLFIGSGALIRTGAYVRGGAWIGDGAVVGANTEVKRSILMAGAKAPHLAYVGDSVLGAGVNLGAGTVLSNFRHDGAEISIPVDGESLGTGSLATGRRKLGAILGDGVKTGCNAVLSPGVVVGARTQTYAGVVLRPGIYAADSIVKLRQQLTIVERRD